MLEDEGVEDGKEGKVIGELLVGKEGNLGPESEEKEEALGAGASDEMPENEKEEAEDEEGSLVEKDGGVKTGNGWELAVEEEAPKRVLEETAETVEENGLGAPKENPLKAVEDPNAEKDKREDEDDSGDGDDGTE